MRKSRYITKGKKIWGPRGLAESGRLEADEGKDLAKNGNTLPGTGHSIQCLQMNGSILDLSYQTQVHNPILQEQLTKIKSWLKEGLQTLNLGCQSLINYWTSLSVSWFICKWKPRYEYMKIKREHVCNELSPEPTFIQPRT